MAKESKKSLKESILDIGEMLVADVVDYFIFDCNLDKKEVEKVIYKKHKLNDFDTLTTDEIINIQDEIEKKSLKESVVYRSDVKTILDKAKELKCHKGLIEDLTAIYEVQSTSDDWEIIDICEGYGEKELLKFVKELLGLKENKNMKKSITEKFDAPKDWDFDEMVEDYGEEYLNDVGSDWEDYIHNMDDLEYYLEKEDLNWLLNRMYYGGQYIKGDFNTKETFDPNEEYYVVNGYGNFYSLSEYYKNDFIKDKIEELNDGEESFYDWCIEEGYFESEEDDE